MKEHRKFAICIPAYNAEKLIQESLMSVIDQTYSDYRIFVAVQSNTPDLTFDAAKAICRKYPDKIEVEYSYTSNCGQTKNAAVDLSREYGTYDYTLAADADDWYIDPSFLDRLSQVADGMVDCVFFRHRLLHKYSIGSKSPLYSSPSEITGIFMPSIAVRTCCLGRFGETSDIWDDVVSFMRTIDNCSTFANLDVTPYMFSWITNHAPKDRSDAMYCKALRECGNFIPLTQNGKDAYHGIMRNILDRVRFHMGD